MDFLNGVDLAKMTAVALMTFGSVSVVTFFKSGFDSKTKWLMSFGFALLYSFIPADLGNIIANKIRDAVAVATGLNGFYQMTVGVLKKVGQDA